jgi:hypothetical protein
MEVRSKFTFRPLYPGGKIGVLVGLGAGLNVVKKRKISCPCQE